MAVKGPPSTPKPVRIRQFNTAVTQVYPKDASGNDKPASQLCDEITQRLEGDINNVATADGSKHEEILDLHDQLMQLAAGYNKIDGLNGVLGALRHQLMQRKTQLVQPNQTPC